MSSQTQLCVGETKVCAELDSEHGYALNALTLGAHLLPCGSGAFPRFDVLLADGQRRSLTLDDARLNAVLEKSSPHKAQIRYEYEGLLACTLTYASQDDGLKITCRVLWEKDAHLIALDDAQMLMCLKENTADPSFAGLAIPAYQGRVLSFASQLQAPEEYFLAAHLHTCNFIAPSFGDAGLLIHPLHYNANFSYGLTQDEDSGQRVLNAGVKQYFRPEKTQDFSLPLCHQELGLELIAVGDRDGNGQCDWRDLAMEYRDRCIPRNEHLKDSLIHGISGGINLQATPNGNFSEWLPFFDQLSYAPQAWWMVSAHVPKDVNLDHLYWDFLPDVTRGSYLKFKQAAQAYDVDLFIHQDWDVVTRGRGWDESIIRRQPDGSLWQEGEWGGRKSYWRSFIAFEQDGRFYRWIDDVMARWDVKKGDLWHCDVYDWYWREDYNPAHPATRDIDHGVRHRLLKYCQDKGIHNSTESLMEGLSDVNDYVHWTFIHNKAVSDEVPMLPILFGGGRSLYAYATNEALPGRDVRLPAINYADSLLSGVKLGWSLCEADVDGVTEVYFKQNLFWAATVQSDITHITQEGQTWQVKYSNGAILTANPQTNEYSLSLNGVSYCGFSPLNANGFMGIWKEGAFEVPAPAAAPFVVYQWADYKKEKLALTTFIDPSGQTSLRAANKPAAPAEGYLHFCRAQSDESAPTSCGSLVVARQLPCTVEASGPLALTADGMNSGEFRFIAHTEQSAKVRLKLTRKGWGMRQVEHEEAPAQWHDRLNLTLEPGQPICLAFHPYIEKGDGDALPPMVLLEQ